MIHPYATESYARSLSHWGEAIDVPEWGCHVIRREAPRAPGAHAAAHAGAHAAAHVAADAAGTYPLAILAADADLGAGLERLGRLGLVSVTLVLDEFHRPPLAELRRYFRVVSQFKTHHIHRNALPLAYGKHHRYEVRKALGRVSVSPFELAHHLPEWTALYGALIKRHGLGSVHEFSADHHRALCRASGITSIGAWMDGRLVSAHIWAGDGRYLHSHLAASSAEGYAVGAAYAVYDASIRHFPEAELLNFGGSAGASDGTGDGLARFKRGFANGCAPAYICGAVLDEARYEQLLRQSGVPADTLFFPAYRARTS